MQKVDLDRYEVTGILGTGADYEVRAATDRETQQPVVLKRPVPQMISRKMHEGPNRTELFVFLLTFSERQFQRRIENPVSRLCQQDVLVAGDRVLQQTMCLDDIDTRNLGATVDVVKNGLAGMHDDLEA